MKWAVELLKIVLPMIEVEEDEDTTIYEWFCHQKKIAFISILKFCIYPDSLNNE